MEEEEVTLLRKKLSLLSYEGDFTSDSAPLVERLVDDLIHTTESYREVRQSLDQQRLEGSACRVQLGTVTKQLQHYKAEAARFRLQLLQVDENEKLQTGTRNRNKEALEEKVVQLQKKLRLSQKAVLQKDRELKALEDDSSGSDKECGQGKLVQNDETSTSPLTTKDGSTVAFDSNAHKLLRAQHRVEDLEEEMSELRRDVDGLKATERHLRDMLNSREHEISRLTAQAEAIDVQSVSAVQNNINENIILQLNSQVEDYKVQMTQLETALKEAKKALKMRSKAQQFKGQSDAASVRLETSNNSLRKEIARLQTNLLASKAQLAGVTGLKSALGQTCVQEILFLRTDLEQSDEGKAEVARIILKAKKDGAKQQKEQEDMKATIQDLTDKLKELEVEKEKVLNSSSSLRQTAFDATVPSEAKSDPPQTAYQMQAQRESVKPDTQKAMISGLEISLKAAHAETAALKKSLVELQDQCLERSERRHADRQGGSELAQLHTIIRQAHRDLDTLRSKLECEEQRRALVEDGIDAIQQRCRICEDSLAAILQAARDNGPQESVQELEHIKKLLEACQKADSAPEPTGGTHKLLVLQKQLAIQTEEAKGERVQAQTAKAAYEAARKRESESTLLAEQQRSRAGRAEAVSSKLQATLDEKIQIQKSVHRSSALGDILCREELDEARERIRTLQQEAETVRKDTDKMKSVMMRSDVLCQDLMARIEEGNVQEIANTAQAKDSAITALQGDVKMREEALNKLHRAAEQLSQAMKAVTDERQSLVQKHHEQVSAAEALKQQLHSKDQQLAKHKKLSSELEALLETNQDSSNELVRQLKKSQKDLEVVNGAKAELQTELSAVAEDIEMLIKENQRLNQLIRGLTAEKHGLQSDIDDQKDQIKQMHATLTDHVTEMNHLRSKLEEAHRHQQQSQAVVFDLQGQLKIQAALAQDRALEAVNMQDLQDASHSQLIAYTSEMQKLEHQVEVLTAQRSETEAMCSEMQAESQHLLERLQAAELVRCDGERQRNVLQRKLAALDQNFRHLEAKHQATSSQKQAMESKSKLDRTHIQELEQLTQDLRSDTFFHQSPSPSPVAERQPKQRRTEHGPGHVEMQAAYSQSIEATAYETDVGKKTSRTGQVQTQKHSRLASHGAPPEGSKALNELSRLKEELEREKKERFKVARDFDELLRSVQDV